MTVNRFEYRPRQVAAMQVGHVPWKRIAEWLAACGIEHTLVRGIAGRYWAVEVDGEVDGAAYIGDWLVRDDGTGEFMILRHDDFLAAFRAVES